MSVGTSVLWWAGGQPLCMAGWANWKPGWANEKRRILSSKCLPTLAWNHVGTPASRWHHSQLTSETSCYSITTIDSWRPWQMPDHLHKCLICDGQPTSSQTAPQPSCKDQPVPSTSTGNIHNNVGGRKRQTSGTKQQLYVSWAGFQPDCCDA